MLSWIRPYAIGGVIALSAAAAIRTMMRAFERTDDPRRVARTSESVDGTLKKKDIPEWMLREQFARNVSFWGPSLQRKIEDAFVVVVGVGGVGSHAAHMLVRSGVRRIRVVDFDQLTLSSLNRHAVGVHEDVGRSKVTVLRDRLHAFAPFCAIETLNIEFNASTADAVLSRSADGHDVDVVLDCIDDVNTKAILLAKCHRMGLRVLSSMGAGGISDPTRLHVGDLSDVVGDKLGRSTLERLRRDHKIGLDRKKDLNITAVYSSEKTRVDLLPLTEEQRQHPDAFGTKPNFRLRIMPVLGTMPAIFGMTMATYCLAQLAGKKMYPVATERITYKFKNKAYAAALLRERDVYKCDVIQFDMVDVEFLIESVFRKRCTITNAMLSNNGSKKTLRKLVLARWDQSKPASTTNMVYIPLWVADQMKERFSGHPTPTTFVMSPPSSRPKRSKGTTQTEAGRHAESGGDAKTTKKADIRIDLTQKNIDRIDRLLSALSVLDYYGSADRM